jgi:hypothetical protein
MSTQTNNTLEIPERKKRSFVAEDFDPSTWEAIEPYYKNLLGRKHQFVTRIAKLVEGLE